MTTDLATDMTAACGKTTPAQYTASMKLLCALRAAMDTLAGMFSDSWVIAWLLEHDFDVDSIVKQFGYDEEDVAFISAHLDAADFDFVYPNRESN